MQKRWPSNGGRKDPFNFMTIDLHILKKRIEQLRQTLNGVGCYSVDYRTGYINGIERVLGIIDEYIQRDLSEKTR